MSNLKEAVELGEHLNLKSNVWASHYNKEIMKQMFVDRADEGNPRKTPSLGTNIWNKLSVIFQRDQSEYKTLCKFEGRMSSEKYISLRKRFGRKLDIVRDLKISVEDTIHAYEIQFPQ